MPPTDAATDERLGIVIVLGIGVVVGGLAMVLMPGEVLGAAGFAAAIVLGLALIVALHLVG